MEKKAETGKSGAKESGSKESGAKEGERKRKKIDLNVPQVAGSAVAAVVAAKLASSFGVYGTILGAGLVSVIATCGGSVFQHFFSRTGEQVREAAEKAKPRVRQVPLTADGRPVPATFRASSEPSAPSAPSVASARAANPSTGPVTTSWRPGVVTAEGDATTALPATGAADATTALPVAGAADATTVLPTAGRAEADRTQLLAPVGVADGDRTQLLTKVDAERTRLLTPVRRPEPEPEDDATTVLARADATMLLRANSGGPGGSSDDETRFLGIVTPEAPVDVPVQGKRIKSWKRPLLGAALIFGVTMAGISTYELVSGNSFSGNDSQVLRPSSWGGASADERRGDTPDDRPSPSTPTDEGGADSGERNPAAEPTVTPDRGSDGTEPQPRPSASQSSDGTEPTAEPSPTESEADPSAEPSSPEPTESATDADPEPTGRPVE
ncbi:hypothetical protein [Streptomyces cavernicola]|uniref:Uncharacterized protein n=1 Tax=Streptomyces cavernicola TaxID=3043613 RepID=A0ABT6S2Y5_9ACTN|nr:hypothetical protein [Streptomyces sp. B-S-A6]MDI3402460.1 hypothetical protein [Streptomyces sp. B-S-A6]